MVQLSRALEAEATVHLAPNEEGAVEPVPEKASAVAEKGSGSAYGADRKTRARASQPSN
jgi:hypothetical protein